MSTVAITGAGGFIGGHLLRGLADTGCELRAIVRKVPAVPLPNVSYFQCSDIVHRDEWEEALAGVDAVVHLVARVHVMQRSLSTNDDYYRANVAASIGVAHACVECSVKRLVYISTIKVNGEVTRAHPFTADDVPTRTHEPYAGTKRDSEAALFDIGQKTGLEVVVIRPPLVYGPGVKGNFFSLMRVIKKQWPLPFASISNSRSLVSVFNLCDLIRVCLTHPAAAGEVFLVCDGEDVSTPHLLRSLAAAMQCKARLVPCPVSLLRLAATLTGQKDKVDRLCGDLRVDMAKTRRRLGWEPPFNFADSIERTVKAFC